MSTAKARIVAGTRRIARARRVARADVPAFLKQRAAYSEAKLDAEQVLTSARAEADRVRQEAEAAAKKIRDRVEEEWSAHQSRLAGVSDEVVERVVDRHKVENSARAIYSAMTEARKVRRDFEGMQPWLIELVETSVLRIIGDVDGRVRWAGLIREGLKSLRSRWDLSIACHPSDCDALQAAITEHPALSGADLTVHSDETLGEGACVLKHPDGMLDLCIASQVAELCRVLSEEIDATQAAGAGV